MGSSDIVSEINGDFSRKSQFFSHPRVYNARDEQVPFRIVYRRSKAEYKNDGATVTRMKFDDTFSRLGTMHERDGQTARRQKILR